MKPRIIFIFLSCLLGAGLFINSIISAGIGNIWQALMQFSIGNFVILFLLSAFNFYLYSLRWELVVKALQPDKKFNFFLFFLHRLSGYALSYITPSAQLGGEPLRIILLEEEGVSRKTATSSIIIDKALELAAQIIFICTGFIVALIDGSVPLGAKGLIWALITVLLGLVFWFYYCSIKNIGFFTSIVKVLHLRKIKRFEKLENKIQEFETEMNGFYKHHKKVMLRLVLLSVLTTTFLLLEHYLMAEFLGVNLSFLQLFLSSTIPYLAYIMPIPGGLGLLESGHAAVFTLTGVTINAFVFVFILRLRDFIFVFLGLAHASRKGINMLKKEMSNSLRNK